VPNLLPVGQGRNFVWPSFSLIADPNNDRIGLYGKRDLNGFVAVKSVSVFHCVQASFGHSCMNFLKPRVTVNFRLDAADQLIRYGNFTTGLAWQ
jgi:hypothetical protein